MEGCLCLKRGLYSAYRLARVVMGGFYAASDLTKEYPLNAPVPAVNIRRATMADVINLFEKAFGGWEPWSHPTF